MIAPLMVVKWPKSVGTFLMLNCLGTPGKWATDPQEAGIENGANFEVQVEQKIDKDKAEEIEKVKDKDDGDEEEEAEGKSQSKIVKGWHIFPDECKALDFSGSGPIFIFCHGSFGTMAESYRVDFYQRLSQKSHVITFDYRGFGESDSIAQVTEDSMVEDVLAIYAFVESKVRKSSSVFLWGHGVGSGAVAHAASLLTQQGQPPLLTGVILSGTFFNIEDLIKKHKWFFWSGVTLYERLFLDAVKVSGFQFMNNEYILDIAAPVAILHADDDEMVPFTSAFRLYEESKRRKNGFLRQFYGLIGSRGIGHRGLATAADLDIVLDCFMDKCDSLSKPELSTGNINKNMVDFKSRTDFLFLETPNIASDSSEMSGTWNASSEPVLEGRVLEGIHMRDEIDGEDEDEDDEEDDDCGRMVVSDDDVDH